METMPRVPDSSAQIMGNRAGAGGTERVHPQRDQGTAGAASAPIDPLGGSCVGAPSAADSAIC